MSAQLRLPGLQEGDGLDAFPPAGEFVLADGDRPVVLISGGVGITPTLAMLDAALERQRPVHFIHCARNKSVHAFRDALATRQARHAPLRHFYVYDEHAGEADAPHATGLIDSGQLSQWLPASRDVDAYFLGPKPLMRRVKRQLRELGVPESQTRYEFFGPAGALD